jgi:DNA polymerase III delta subunit
MMASAGILLRDIDKLSKSEEELLAAYAGDPSPTRARPQAPKLAGTAHRRLIEAGAAAAVFWTLFERDAVEWIRLRFQDLGKRCDPATAGELLAACGAGPGQGNVALSEIAPEVEKVSLAMGPRTQVLPHVTGTAAASTRLRDGSFPPWVSGTTAALRARQAPPPQGMG